jgi:MoaA/NifB/PqqE/SkfB family radical SAM enzyme
MCFGWIKQNKIKEPSLDKIRTVFYDKVLKNNLEIINLTGGEPTLREDLVDIVKIILENCPRLKYLDIPTNGVNTQQVIDQIERILALLLPTNVKLSVTVSLDGVGEMHELVRQGNGIFYKIEQTIDALKELMPFYPFFSLGLNMTISKINYKTIEEVKKYAMQKGIGINFTLSAISDIGV